MGEVTALIEAANSGDAKAQQALFARVYAELKQMARKQLSASAGHSINTTGLVHEAYLKLAQPSERALQGRVHFFALAAKAMRQIVIDHARARLSEKRGGEGLQLVTLDAALEQAGDSFDLDELLRVNRALDLLEADDPRLAQLVEMRFFAGLGLDEIAALLSVSPRTVDRDWRRAKAQLYAALHPGH